MPGDSDGRFQYFADRRPVPLLAPLGAQPEGIEAPGNLALAEALPGQADDDYDELGSRFTRAPDLRGTAPGGLEVRIAELDAARLGDGEGIFDPGRNHQALVLGDGGEDLDRQPRRMRVVAGDKIDPTLHQAGDEMDVARQPVELGNDQGRLASSASRQRAGDPRPVVPLATFDLGEVGDDITPPADLTWSLTASRCALRPSPRDAAWRPVLTR
jgi:hypothetical protein